MQRSVLNAWLKRFKNRAKAFIRMLSPSGNPTMENLSAIFAAIKKALHVKIDTTVTAA